ncbi:unnamed protein product [Closterium sp. NIES-53]
MPRLRGMASCTLVSGLPWSLLPLPPRPAPTWVPCVEGRQCAAPHSSEFPPTEAPLQTLHMDVGGPARVRGQGHERYFPLVVDDYSRYTTVFPLRRKGEVTEVLIDWIRGARRQLSESFGSDIHTFTLPASPQQNGIAERRIGMVMDVARTSMIHAAAPHFLWPFAVQYATHQINLQPRVSLTETTPTLRWTGKVGDASVFRVWGSRAFVRDASANKLSSRAVPCVFLGFPPDAPGWQFYHPTSRRVLSSKDVTFDESVSYYRLFPYRTAPLPPPPRFLAPVERVDPVEVAVDSGAARGTEPAGVGTWGAGPGVAESEGAEPGGAELERVVPGGAAPGNVESRGAGPGGAEPARAESGDPLSVPSRWEPLSPQRLREWYARRCSRAAGATGPAARGASGAGAAGGVADAGAAGGASGAGAAGGAAGAGAAGAAGPGGAGAGGTRAVGGPADVGAAGGAGAAGPGGTRIGGTGAAGAGGAAGLEAVGAAGAGVVGGAGAVATGVAARAGAVGGTGAGGAAGVVAGDPGAEGTGAVSAVSGGAARPRPYYVPLLQQVLGLPPSTGPTPPLLSPPPVQSQSQLQPASPLPSPSPYSGLTRGLAKRREPESRPASPESRPVSPKSRPESHVRAVLTGRRVPRQRPPPVPSTHSMTLRPSTAPQRVPLPSPPAFSLPDSPDPESDSLRAASPTVTRFLATAITDPSLESTAASALVAELVDFATACRLDYAASLVAESAFASVCPPSFGGECALGTDVLEDRQEEFECFAAAAAMDAEMASWKSRGTYIDEVPPHGANIVSGMWIFRVKRPPGSPLVFKARYVAQGFSQRQVVDSFQTFSPTPKMTTLRVLLHVAAQRHYELHSLDFSTAFLHGSLHEEIWLRRPPGFTGSFPAGTQWSLRRPVYGLRQAPCEWHDTLRTTLAALGFSPSTADPSLFLRTDTTLPPFYVLVYVDDLVFATANTGALAHVKSELQKRHTCTDLEPSGSYQELVGCLMYLMTCTRPDLAYPLSLVARYVAPDRHGNVHWDVAKRVLRYLFSTSGMGLVLGGRARVVLTGHADASWVDDSATQRSSSGEAEIYAGAMAVLELRWLTYLLTDLGEAPRSPPVLYVDNKAMLALCQEHRLDHKTKHISLRYFLARELQQRGQLRLA